MIRLGDPGTYRLHHDFETFSSQSVLVVGADRYSRAPDTEVLMCAYAFDDGAVKQWLPVEGEEMPSELLEAMLDPYCIKFAWNKAFEWAIWKNVLGVNTPHNQWRDPMVLAYSLSFPGALAKCGDIIGLPEDKKKLSRGKQLIRKFCMLQKASKRNPQNLRIHPHDAWDDWEDFLKYNRQDVEAERAIWRRLRRYDMPQHEWDLWFLDQKINEAGVPISVPTVNNAIKVYDEVYAKSFSELQGLTQLNNPNSTTQILPWLRDNGYPYVDCQKAHIKRALEYMEEPPTKWPMEVRQKYSANKRLGRVLELRLQTAKAAPKKYATLKKYVDEESGVIRDVFQFAGAGRTWRWAGRKWQAQNLTKPTKELEPILWSVVRALKNHDAETLEMVYGDVFEVLSSCVRPVAQAPKGSVFIDVDLSAIENRVLGWMTGCEAILDVFREGKDPYIAFAAKLFKLPYAQLWHEYHDLGDSSKRTIAKPGVLGAGYMLGAGETQVNKKTDELEATGLLGYAWNMKIREFTLEDSKLSVDTFRSSYREVKKYWYAIDSAARKCIRTKRTVDVGPVTFMMDGPFMKMRLPSGRSLHYFRPRIKDKKTPWGEVRPTVCYDGLNDRKQWVEISTHPGKWTENADQAISRDILAHGMTLADNEGLDIRIHVHDQTIALAPESVAEEQLQVLRECMQDRPSWAKDLPLGSAGFISPIFTKD